MIPSILRNSGLIVLGTPGALPVFPRREPLRNGDRHSSATDDESSLKGSAELVVNTARRANSLIRHKFRY
jgi:hypothetical protein